MKKKTKPTMKKNSLFEKLIQFSQSELESMSITRQGTVTVKVKKDTRLPDVEVKGADVTIGNGKIVVSKRRTAQPYTGNVTKCIHHSQSSYGTTRVRVSNNGTVTVKLVGTTKSIRDKHDILAALDLSSNMFAMDHFDNRTSDIEDEMMLAWSKAKKLHDEQEKREVRAWDVREKNDMEKLKVKN